MFPNMTEAITGFEQQAQFALVKSVQENFDTVESPKKVAYFLGSLQPITPRDLLVKPEGWRRWKWYKLWTLQRLEIGDYVQDPAELQYRVMSKNDWSQANYFEYELTQGATIGAEAA